MEVNTFGVVGGLLLSGLVGLVVGWALRSFVDFRPFALPATSPQSQTLRWVEQADAVADFRQHVEREHDMRFLSRYGLGFGSEFPGLKDTPEMQQLVRDHKSRAIEGGDDIMTSREQELLQAQIGIYATTYNAMLLGYLECLNRPNQSLQPAASPHD